MDTLSKFIIQFLQDFLHSKSSGIKAGQGRISFTRPVLTSRITVRSRDSPSSKEENADGGYQNDEIHDSNNHSDTENVMANSTSLPISAAEFCFEVVAVGLDTQLEIVIENLHKEYDQFINSIRLKFEKLKI